MLIATWRRCPLGKLFEIGAGKTMSAAARNGAGKTPFLRTSNVLWDEIDLSSVDEMVIPEPERSAKLLRPGDLLVCEGGTIGRAAIWTGEMEAVSFQNHLHRLRPTTRSVEPRFYVYFLQSAFTQLGLFEGAGNRTTIPNLSRSCLASLEVPVPPIEEQRAIVATLAGIRKAVGAQDRAAAVVRQLKRAAMRTLFARGLRCDPQKETEIGPVPESWDVLELETAQESIQYGTSVRCSYGPTSFPVLRIPNIEAGHINTDDLKFCKPQTLHAHRYTLERGDLLFIRTNGVLERLGVCAVYDGKPANALFASYLIRSRLKSDCVVPRFAAYFFGSDIGSRSIADRATPAADGKFNLNAATIGSLPLLIPPTLNEQREIVSILDALDRKAELHRRKRAVLDDLFQAVLYKLMIGELRFTDLDVSAA